MKFEKQSSQFVAMACHHKKIFDELLKKRNEGLDVKIIIDNNRVIRRNLRSLWKIT